MEYYIVDIHLEYIDLKIELLPYTGDDDYMKLINKYVNILLLLWLIQKIVYTLHTPNIKTNFVAWI